MVHKTHQEEISGPSDKANDATLARDLPRPKRKLILSRKARENESQNQTFEVHSDSATINPDPSSTST
ncbi:hypothetical protein GJ744_001092 [Endocarpon pusillum]|uniref:Uncharacterized protein n=1 Tax=Endocarpon pusillum TaxID=364733 RepID=A0A8H7A9X6_9EURO|nr:hypothetical protein GJ744_001092 [Endocarpon pusillum]